MSSLILFRTHRFDVETAAFFETLKDEAMRSVLALIDGLPEAPSATIKPYEDVSRRVLATHGLYCPLDVSWRCGDYGLYVAAGSYPSFRYYWLVEYDVRIHTADLAGFFTEFDSDDADLIAPMFGERGEDWWWRPSMASGRAPVYGCMFPILRVSARLVQAGLEARRRMSRSPVHRLFWPNDECFLATLAMRRGFRCRDFNTAERRYYRADTFSFTRPIDGEAFDRTPPDGLLHHPVLYGADYLRKLRHVEQPTPMAARVRRKLRAMSALLT